MRYEMNAVHDGLAGSVQDVARDAVAATATTYGRSPQIDVVEVLRDHLTSRGIRSVNPDWLADTARTIRSGHRAAP